MPQLTTAGGSVTGHRSVTGFAPGFIAAATVAYAAHHGPASVPVRRSLTGQERTPNAAWAEGPGRLSMPLNADLMITPLAGAGGRVSLGGQPRSSPTPLAVLAEGVPPVEQYRPS